MPPTAQPADKRPNQQRKPRRKNKSKAPKRKQKENRTHIYEQPPNQSQVSTYPPTFTPYPTFQPSYTPPRTYMYWSTGKVDTFWMYVRKKPRQTRNSKRNEKWEEKKGRNEHQAGQVRMPWYASIGISQIKYLALGLLSYCRGMSLTLPRVPGSNWKIHRRNETVILDVGTKVETLISS